MTIRQLAVKRNLIILDLEDTLYLFEKTRKSNRRKIKLPLQAEWQSRMLTAEEFQVISSELNFLQEDVDRVIEAKDEVLASVEQAGRRQADQRGLPEQPVYKTSRDGYFRVGARLTSNWAVAYSVTHRPRDASIVILDTYNSQVVRPLLNWNEPQRNFRRLRRAGSDRPLGCEYSANDVKLPRRQSVGERDLCRAGCFRVYTSYINNWIFVVGPGSSEKASQPVTPVVKTIYIPSFTIKKLNLVDRKGAFWPATATFCPDKENDACVALIRTRSKCLTTQALSADYGDLVVYDTESEEILQEYSSETFSTQDVRFLLHGKQLMVVTKPEAAKHKANAKPKTIVVFLTDSLTPVLRIPIDEFGSVHSIHPLYSLCGSSLALFITSSNTKEIKVHTNKANTFPQRVKPGDTSKKSTIHKLLKRLSLSCIRTAAFDSTKEVQDSDSEEAFCAVKVYDVPLSTRVLPLAHLAGMVVAQEAPSSAWKRLPLSKELRKYVSYMKQY